MLEADKPTDQRYGWLLVGVGMLSIGFQAALFFASGVLLVAIPEETGWSRTATATALSSLVIGNGIASPFVGTLLQRWGPRVVMVGGSFLFGIGLFAMSLTRSPEELAVVMLTLISGGSTAMGSLPVFTALQEWFRERRGTALSIADTGASLGLMFLVPLFQQLTLAVGWRGACQVGAGIAIALGLLHLVTQRRPPARPAPGGPAAPAPHSPAGLTWVVRQPRVWLIGLGLATSRFAFQLVAVHQVAYLIDQGFSPTDLATAFALTGLAGLAGRPGFGWLSDRIGATTVYAVLTGCLLVAIGGLVLAGQSGLLPAVWLFAVSFGAALGVGTLLFARRVSDVVGSRGFGSALGFASAIGSIGGAGGTAGAALAYDATGTYLSSFAAAAIMATISLACMWQLGRPQPRSTPAS